jgi:exodeoxyribonuclease VII small subunit
MTKKKKSDENEIDDNLTYEQKVEKLDKILTRLDNSETPIDKLAEDVKEGARLIKELDKKLKQVETEVRDAFKDLDEEPSEG